MMMKTWKITLPQMVGGNQKSFLDHSDYRTLPRIPNCQI